MRKIINELNQRNNITTKNLCSFYGLYMCTNTHSLIETLNCYCFIKGHLLLYSFIDQIINDIHMLSMLLKYGEYKK